MTDAPASGVSTSELLRESWRLLRGHARLFVLLMGVAILAQLLAVLARAVVVFSRMSSRTRSRRLRTGVRDLLFSAAS